MVQDCIIAQSDIIIILEDGRWKKTLLREIVRPSRLFANVVFGFWDTIHDG